MSAEFYEAQDYLRISLRGEEPAFPTLLDVSAFLYDFNMLYEVARLAVDPDYDSFRFDPRSGFYAMRRGRPLREFDRLHVESIRLGSPLDAVTVVAIMGGAIAAVWGVIQSVERISNWPLNRRKLKAEVEKLERENAKALEPPREESAAEPVGLDVKVPEALLSDFSRSLEEERFERRLEERGAVEVYRRVEARLDNSSIRVKVVEVEIVHRLPEK